MKGHKNLLEVMDMDMFITLIMVRDSQVYAYVQTHQNVYIEYVKFLYIKYNSIKLKKKERKTSPWLQTSISVFYSVTTQVEILLSEPQILSPQLDKHFHH